MSCDKGQSIQEPRNPHLRQAPRDLALPVCWQPPPSGPATRFPNSSTPGSPEGLTRSCAHGSLGRGLHVDLATLGLLPHRTRCGLGVGIFNKRLVTLRVCSTIVILKQLSGSGLWLLQVLWPPGKGRGGWRGPEGTEPQGPAPTPLVPGQILCPWTAADGPVLHLH